MYCECFLLLKLSSLLLWFGRHSSGSDRTESGMLLVLLVYVLWHWTFFSASTVLIAMLAARACLSKKNHFKKLTIVSFREKWVVVIIALIVGLALFSRHLVFSVVIKIWYALAWWYVFKPPSGSFEKSTTLWVRPGSTLRPGDVLGPEPPSIIQRLQPLRGPFHSEVIPVPKVPAPNLKL